MKYQRGINQCHIASDKIIEVRSNGRKVRSNGMKVRSNAMEVRSNGRKVRSNGMKVRSNEMEVQLNGRKVRSNGIRTRSNEMQVAIRLHFCPECPSIQLCHTFRYAKWFYNKTIAVGLDFVSHK